jgi:hypothetical protein
VSHNAPAKRFLDIEMALRWAYRDELPKRRHGGDPIGIGSTFPSGIGLMFGADEAPARDPGFPAAVGEPHADALAIEVAVKGLSTWWGHGFGPDPTAAGLMYGIDHMAIDHVAAGVEAVASMPAIVAVHARVGTRPLTVLAGGKLRWRLFASPEPLPDRGANGKPKVLIDETFVEVLDRRGRVCHVEASKLDPQDWPDDPITHTQPVPCAPIRAGRYREGAYCPLVYKPTPVGIVAERAEYAAWRMGLGLLHQALEGRLGSIAVLAPSAPWRPWADEREAHGRPPELFKGRRDEPYRRITREQEAARRRAAQRRRLQPRTEQTRRTRVSSPLARRDDGTNGA